MPTRTRQKPSHRLQQNDKHCLKTCLLKALLVNGSLGKIANTKHAVQLPKNSALPCAWAKPGYRRNQRVTKDARQDFSNDVAPWPWCRQKLLGNSSDFCYWCKLSSLWGGDFLFNDLCTFPVLFENAMLNSLLSPSPAPCFFHTSDAHSLTSLTFTTWDRQTSAAVLKAFFWQGDRHPKRDEFLDRDIPD